MLLSGTTFIMALEHRSLRVEERFFSLLKEQHFQVTSLSWQDHHPTYRSQAIDIYYITATTSSSPTRT